MIELLRYARLKPDGLVSFEVQPNMVEPSMSCVVVKFKRFNVENGREETPEESVVTFKELEARQAEIEIEMEAVKELLAKKPQ